MFRIIKAKRSVGEDKNGGKVQLEGALETKKEEKQTTAGLFGNQAASGGLFGNLGKVE